MNTENVKQLDVKVKMPFDSKNPAMAELEQGVFAALETYSNVHRGSGHFSLVSTQLFDQARSVVLNFLQLKKSQYTVIFCTPRNAELLKKQIQPASYKSLSSQDFGLTLGVRALAVQRSVLRKVVPFQAGGGTARLIAKDWIVWAKTPDKFEPGTPAIINIIAFAKALQMIERSGKDFFMKPEAKKITAAEILYKDDLEKFSGQELLEELRKTLIGSGFEVPTMKGMRPFINLDNSASTRTFAPVFKAFRQTMWQLEPIKQDVVQEVKSICLDFLNASASDYEVIFTANTTESINLAAENLGLESDSESEPVVLNTLLEHSSNDLPWRMIPNCQIIRLDANTDGFIDLSELENLLKSYNLYKKHGKQRIRILALSGASNVLGICNNLPEVCKLIHQYGARLLVDAAQLVAHRKIDMDKCGIDYLAFSAHKIYAPFGCGALVVRKGLLNFNPEELELIQLSGEENAGGIAALGKALVLLQRIGMDLIEKEERELTSRALEGIRQIKELDLYGIINPESSSFDNKIGVIPLNLKNKMATQVGKKLAISNGIGLRTGCHCAHIIVKHMLNISPGLERFQRVIVTLFPNLALPGLVRVSFGLENNEHEVDLLIQALKEIASKSQNSSNKEIKKQMNEFIGARSELVYSNIK